MNHARDAFRKAAVLIDSLDRRSADALLDQMGEAQASRIRQAVVELDDVSPEEREQVMSDFLAGQKPPRNMGVRNVAADDDGIEIDASLAARLSEDYDEAPAPMSATSPAPSPPFRLLLEADTGVIARFLDRENPQAVAVVLAHLPPERSADVLARLTPDRQTDVIRRIVHLSETPPEVLLDVEHELGSKLSEQLSNVHRREEGLAAMRRILGAADASLRKDLLTQVAAADASLSDQLLNSRTDEPRPAAVERRIQPAAHQRDARRPLAGSWPPAASPRAEQYLRKPASKSRPPWLSGTAEPPVRPSQVGASLAKSGDGDRHEENDQRVPASASKGLRDDGISLERSGLRAVPSEVAAEPSREERSPAARFDDVARLSNPALATLFSDIDTEVAVLALTAADRKLVQRVLKQLPRREAKSLAKQLAQPVPMRLREVERAQQEIANIAQELELSGQIQWNKSTERLAAVA